MKKTSTIEFIAFAKRWYGIPDDVHIGVSVDTSIDNIHIGNGNPISAHVNYVNDKSFMIKISPKYYGSTEILGHEIAHVHQIIRGDLYIDKVGRKFMWKGLEYDVSLPYKSRPWEIEAAQKKDEVCKAFKRYTKRR